LEFFFLNFMPLFNNKILRDIESYFYVSTNY